MDLPMKSITGEDMSDVRTRMSDGVISSLSIFGKSEEIFGSSKIVGLKFFDKKSIQSDDESNEVDVFTQKTVPSVAPGSPPSTSVINAATMISGLRVRTRSNSVDSDSSDSSDVQSHSNSTLKRRRLSALDEDTTKLMEEELLGSVQNSDIKGFSYETPFDVENPFDALDDPEVIITKPKSKTMELIDERRREQYSLQFKFSSYQKLAAEVDAMKNYVASHFHLATNEISSALQSDPIGVDIKVICQAFNLLPLEFSKGMDSDSLDGSWSTISSSTHSSSSDYTLSDSSASLSERIQMANIESSSESHRSDSSSGSGNLISNLSSLRSSSSSSSGDVCEAPFHFSTSVRLDARKDEKKKQRVVGKEPTRNADQVFEQRVVNQFIDIFMNDKDASSDESVQTFSSEVRHSHSNHDSRNLESDSTSLAAPILKTLTTITNPTIAGISASTTSTGSTDTGNSSCAPSTLTAPIASSITPSTESVSEFDRKLMGTLDQASQTFLLTDPNMPGNPIVFASGAFFAMVGYAPEEVIGKNCRFLQGPETDPIAIDMISRGLRSMKDVNVCILNYRKDGSKFYNRLYVAPLRKSNGELSRFIGVQCPVEPSIGRFLRRAQQKTYKFMFGNKPECEKIIQESIRRGIFSETFDDDSL
jgi:PAS domain S-box-containing protein